jgi:hypothetical protein
MISKHCSAHVAPVGTRVAQPVHPWVDWTAEESGLYYHERDNRVQTASRAHGTFYKIGTEVLKRRCSAVGIAITYAPLWGKEFSLLHIVQTGSEAHQPSMQWVQGLFLWGLVPGV